MDAVTAGFMRQVGPVIHNESNVAVLRYGPQDISGAANVIVRDILQSKLNAGDVARIQRFRKWNGERRRVDARRRVDLRQRARW